MKNIKTEDYKKLGYREFSKVHQMTSYLAMFPPNLPYYFVNKLTQEGDIVFDPFSGRGTSVFEACRLGRIGVGNDLSSLAYFLTKSKVNLPQNKKYVLKRLEELHKKYERNAIDISQIEERIQMLFNEETLSQLLYLQKNLKPCESNIDLFILSTLTGIMHGRVRKDGSSQYLSISMPNTFSMSANYVKSFIEKHQLKKPKQNVFELLEKRIHTIFPLENLYENGDTPLNSLKEYRRGKAYNLDAIESSQEVIRTYGKHSISLIVTSPPYLDVINYAKYNWIRLWLTDYFQPIAQEKIKKIDIRKFDAYSRYMKDLFNSWSLLLKSDAYALVVIGDVKRSNGEVINLAQTCWERIQEMGGCELELETILEDKIVDEENLEASNPKVSRIWGTKKGRSTQIDRILVLKRRVKS